MDQFLDVALTNAVTAALPAILIVLAEGLGSRLGRRMPPALVRGFWVLVLLRLLCPPIFDLGVPLLPELPEVAAVGAVGAAVPVVAAAPSAGSLLTWKTVPIVCWLVGSLFFVGLATVRTIRLWKTIQRGEGADLDLLRRVDRLAGELRISRPPRVTVVGASVSPMLWATLGIRRLVLPKALLVRLSAAELDTLLVHELAHLQRRDVWVRGLELTALTLYWWHPVAWWACRRLRRAEETCCDALVTRTLPGHRRAYADCLLKTMRFLAGNAPLGGVPVSALAGFHNWKGRLTMILSQRNSPYLSSFGRGGLLAMACAMLLVFPTLARQGGESNAEPLDLHLKGAPLSQILESFGHITGLHFLTQPDVDLTAPVTVELNKVPWDQALEKILQAEGLHYSTEGRILWIYGAEGRHSPEHIFSGDPIDLDLKDAPLAQVLAGFSEIANRRFILQGDHEGLVLVTVTLKQVPWDQAVDAILRLQGLTYTAEGDEIRVFRAQS